MQDNKKRKLESQLTNSNINQQIKTSTSCTYSCSIEKALNCWPILYAIDKNILLKTHMIMAIESDNKNEDEFIIVRKTGNVYLYRLYSQLAPLVITNLCGKNIKTFIPNHKNGLFALTYEGEVYSWGINDNYTLGHILETKVFGNKIVRPLLVTGLINENIVDIACGKNHALALTVDGKVYAWGKNIFQWISNSDIYEWRTPKQVTFELKNKKVVWIACGESYSIVVTDNGEVYAWGSLHKSISTEQSMHKITFSMPIVKVACGSNHALALTDQGNLYVWGKNNFGQLGTGNKTDIYNPLLSTSMGTLTDIAAVSTKDISVAVDKDGCFYIWGLYQQFEFEHPFKSFHKNMCDVFASENIMNKPLLCIADDYESYRPKHLKDIFDDANTSDYTVQAEKRNIYVHRYILKMYGSLFKTVFENNWEENKGNTYNFRDFSYNVCKAYLKYLYTGVIDIPSDEVLELLKLAEVYQETNLKKDCFVTVRKEITVSNVAFFYKKAKDYNAKELEEFCSLFIVKNLRKVLDTDNYKQLDKDTMLMFVKKAIDAGSFKM